MNRNGSDASDSVGRRTLVGGSASDRRLRILWLSQLVPYPPIGGSAQRTYQLLRQAAARHEIHLVALNQRSLLPTPDALQAAVGHLSGICAGVTAFSMPWDKSRLRRWAITALSFVRETPYETSWLHSPAMHNYVRAIAASQAFDLIHIGTIGLMSYTASFRSTPLVLDHQDIESYQTRRRAEREAGGLRRLYLQRDAYKLERLERESCARVALNLTVSEADANRLRAIAATARTLVVTNGVDVHYFRPSHDGERERNGLVFSGSLAWFPNRAAVRYLLTEIWPALVADDPRRRITIVGQQPPPELLAATRDPRVCARGRVDDVRPYLEAASIYVCPIRDGGGPRIKILDALAMGTALVATERAIDALDLVEGEHYLRAETPSDYVAQVRRIETDPELRARLARAGRRLVEERYSWEAIGRSLDRGYRAAVESR